MIYDLRICNCSNFVFAQNLLNSIDETDVLSSKNIDCFTGGDT